MEVLFLFPQSIIHLDLKYSRYKNPIYADFTKNTQINIFYNFLISLNWVGDMSSSYKLSPIDKVIQGDSFSLSLFTEKLRRS